ncbi:MAG: hypothetical protein CMF74_18455 [Maricaulis sp.]|jgi:AraC family transcriptional regulator|nr:hypothetical protein [Maricaulis sp.]
MIPARSHGFHRHDNARLIIFKGGGYRERTLTGEARLAHGDFILRPACHAHDGQGESSAGYVSIPIDANVLRDCLARHGHAPRRGRVPDDWDGDGHSLLKHVETRPYESRPDCTPLDRAASRLIDPEPPALSDLAEELDLKPWEFSRAFRARFGLSPTGYRCEARLQRAISLMVGAPARLSQIAADAGYADQSHFCRELRQRTGHTASRLARLVGG